MRVERGPAQTAASTDGRCANGSRIGARGPWQTRDHRLNRTPSVSERRTGAGARTPDMAGTRSGTDGSRTAYARAERLGNGEPEAGRNAVAGQGQRGRLRSPCTGADQRDRRGGAAGHAVGDSDTGRADGRGVGRVSRVLVHAGAIVGDGARAVRWGVGRRVGQGSGAKWGQMGTKEGELASWVEAGRVPARAAVRESAEGEEMRWNIELGGGWGGPAPWRRVGQRQRPPRDIAVAWILSRLKAADKPNSVPRERGGDHLSAALVAQRL